MRVGMCCTRRAIRRRISVAYQYVWVHNRTLARTTVYTRRAKRVFWIAYKQVNLSTVVGSQ